MYSTQAWAAHYGLPLNAPDDFVQGYADGMRLDAKGQGKPCGRGFIPANKKCSAKGSQQLAADLRAGDLGAKARVERGKQNAMAQQKARRGQVEQAATPKRSSEAVAKGKATREANKAKQQALWGSKANVPKRLQRQTLTIEGDKGHRGKGKVHRTRLIKGRSSQSALLRRGMGLEGVSERTPQTERTKSKRSRSPESIAKGLETRKRNREADAKAGGRMNRITQELEAQGKLPDLGTGNAMRGKRTKK